MVTLMSVSSTSPSRVSRCFPPFMSGSMFAFTDHPSPSMPPCPVTTRFSALTSPLHLTVIPAETISPATGPESVAVNSVLVVAFQLTALVEMTSV